MVTVGICDDEKQQRTMLRRIAESYFQLLGEEYKVEEYEGGESLLQKIQQDPYGTELREGPFHVFVGISDFPTIVRYVESVVVQNAGCHDLIG